MLTAPEPVRFRMGFPPVIVTLSIGNESETQDGSGAAGALAAADGTRFTDNGSNPGETAPDECVTGKSWCSGARAVDPDAGSIGWCEKCHHVGEAARVGGGNCG